VVNAFAERLHSSQCIFTQALSLLSARSAGVKWNRVESRHDRADSQFQWLAGKTDHFWRMKGSLSLLLHLRFTCSQSRPDDEQNVGAASS
jgi:hypothetical protein